MLIVIFLQATLEQKLVGLELEKGPTNVKNVEDPNELVVPLLFNTKMYFKFLFHKIFLNFRNMQLLKEVMLKNMS